jgi:hypothetical protein
MRQSLEAIKNLHFHILHQALIHNYAFNIWWNFTIENKPIPAESVSKLMMGTGSSIDVEVP